VGASSASSGEETLAIELRARGLAFEREVPFAEGRRWRFDFVVRHPLAAEVEVAVEVDGGAYSGGHRRGPAADGECDKANAAVLAGWLVLHFTPAQVERGEAISTIEAALALEVEALE
jgi:hypothetical protein